MKKWYFRDCSSMHLMNKPYHSSSGISFSLLHVQLKYSEPLQIAIWIYLFLWQSSFRSLLNLNADNSSDFLRRLFNLKDLRKALIGGQYYIIADCFSGLKWSNFPPHFRMQHLLDDGPHFDCVWNSVAKLEVINLMLEKKLYFLWYICRGLFLAQKTWKTL